MTKKISNKLMKDKILDCLGWFFYYKFLFLNIIFRLTVFRVIKTIVAVFKVSKYYLFISKNLFLISIRIILVIFLTHIRADCNKLNNWTVYEKQNCLNNLSTFTNT